MGRDDQIFNEIVKESHEHECCECYSTELIRRYISHETIIPTEEYPDGKLFKPIRDFPFIWNLFGRIASESVKGDKMDLELIVSLPPLFCPTEERIQKTYGYFVGRYYDGESITDAFKSLWPSERKKKRAEVIKILSEADPSLENKDLTCKLIILRLRNNLFHGVKDLRALHEQSDLFMVANRYLGDIIEKTYK